MTFEIGLMLFIILALLVLFSFEWVPADVIALGLVIVLVFTKLIPADQAFAGFGSDTVMMILGLLILTAALLRTGVIDLAGRFILQKTGNNPTRLLAVVMVSASLLSAFMSNTACTAFFVPVVLGIANRAKVSPSKLLMPLAFSSILSSSVSLISTSTNIVVSGVIERYDMEPMGMFELAPVGIPITVLGLIYVFFIGRRLIPDRSSPDDGLLGRFGVRAYLTEIIIQPSSYLVGKTIRESGLGKDLDLTILRVIREKTQYFSPRADMILRSGDVLLVEGKSEDILKIKDTAGIDIKADVKLTDPNLQTENVALVEVILLQKSPLIGRTLKSFGFRERYGLQVLGINRHGENIRRKISQVPLRMGDVLLIQGARANIRSLEEDHTFRILGSLDQEVPNRRRARLAVAIFVGALALGSFKILSFPVAVMLGAVVLFATRCVTPEEAYREVEWKAVILIGCMLALGTAMEHTGTAKYVAGLITEWVKGTGPIWLLAGFFILTVVLSQPMSNQAAAIVILPIAIQTALQLGLNPRSFAMTVAVAASCSYLTPLEPSCLMVYGPGRYKFMDFFRVGLLLTVLIFALAIFLIPKVWPLAGSAAR